MTAHNLKEHNANNLATFSNALQKNRFWHILPRGVTDLGQSLGVFETSTQTLWPTTTALDRFLGQHPFLYVHDARSQKYLATLHTATLLLWNNESSSQAYSLDAGKKRLQEGRWAGLSGWQFPSKDMLAVFAQANDNPHRQGQAFRLRIADGNEAWGWLTDAGFCHVDIGEWTIREGAVAFIFAIHPHWQNASRIRLLLDLAEKGWELRVPPQANAVFKPPVADTLRLDDPLANLLAKLGKDLQHLQTNLQRVIPQANAVFKPPVADTRWLDVPLEDLLTAWSKEGLHLQSYAGKANARRTTLNPQDFELTPQFADLDYTPCRLPRLDNAQLSDPEKGLWELWGDDAATLKQTGLIARDPGRDLQRRAVAIDFGTSSTVVAVDTAQGARELLRIGVRDFYETITAQQFENPTVLECVDFNALHAAWSAQAYRPALNWDWMRAAHEAQSNFRDNPGDTQVLASILPRLKQWALRSGAQQRVRLTDRKGHELELPAHTERNPVRGQPLAVSASDPFDPVELYAWYLGMAINWRGRGLFLKYYLSFPVKYQREVKDCILASFRRGLQRSLPQSLIDHHPQVLHDFEVCDLASEPAAYAAAALPHLGVEPTDEGVPYAVFDFGGGTTDFDFGLLRWATEDEEDQGYERVFEHLASSGDNFLGGENLLEHLVYESFQHNLPVLREKRIQFTQPLDALPFAGSEAFLAPTQAAQTNTVMLAAKLRPFLESDTAGLESQLKLELIDANGHKQTCELALDGDALDALLARRMRRGVEAFLAELARLRPQLPAHATIHILLAGNGSRSRHIAALFDGNGELWPQLLAQSLGECDREAGPDIVIHPPLPMNDAQPHAPTTKTGVALGLLRLVPGENTLLHNRVHERHDGQAPFAWFVGRMRRGRFEPLLSPDILYGEWVELGALQQGVFHLFATTSPRAYNGMGEGDPELRKHRQDFPAAAPGSRLFARATAPDTVELAAAPNANALTDTVVRTLPLQ